MNIVVAKMYWSTLGQRSLAESHIWIDVDVVVSTFHVSQYSVLVEDCKKRYNVAVSSWH
jgi:hypothetical protein